MVLRVSVGNKYGAQPAKTGPPCVPISSLKVAFPVTPYDAKGMLNTNLSGTDPVVFFESQRLYNIGEEFEESVPEGYYEVPVGEPAKRREGSDITIVTVGAVLYRALEAAKTLEENMVSRLGSGTPVGLTHSTTSHSLRALRRPVVWLLPVTPLSVAVSSKTSPPTLPKVPSVTWTRLRFVLVAATGSAQVQNWKKTTSHKLNGS